MSQSTSPTAEQVASILTALAGGSTQALHDAVHLLLHEVFSDQVAAAVQPAADAAADTGEGLIARLESELAHLKEAL